MVNKFIEGVGYFICATVIMAIWDLLWAFPIMWTWNYVMPYLFQLPKLNWGMSFCLLFILTSLWKIHLFAIPKDKK